MSLYTQLYVYIVCLSNSTNALSEERRNPLVVQNYITLFENQIKSVIYHKVLKFEAYIGKKKPLQPLCEVQWLGKSSLDIF